MNIRIENLTKAFGHNPRVPAVKDASLTIRSGELVALVGPSGSGKTTLLRLIAGLVPQDGGRVFFGDREVTDLGTEERNVGLVFQHYALFPHMRVAGNVSFGLRARPRALRPPRSEIDARVLEWLKVVHLEGLERRFPSQLSGGQRQRVGLARALAVEPDVLLLDEPFGALDALVRKDLRRWLRELHARVSLTSILVTHDQEEALEVADRIVVLRDGVIQQAGTPWEVYQNPVNRFVCEFLGEVNTLTAETVADGFRIGPAFVPAAHSYGEGRRVAVHARPHEIELRTETPGAGSVPAVLLRSQLAGPTARFRLRRHDLDEAFEVTVPHASLDEALSALKPGDAVHATFRVLRSFPANAETGGEAAEESRTSRGPHRTPT